MSKREELLRALPVNVRNAYLYGTDSDLAEAQEKLESEEKDEIRQILQKISNLEQPHVNLQEEPQSRIELFDSSSLDLEDLCSTTDDLPTDLFMHENTTRVIPPRAAVDVTVRSTASRLYPVFFATNRKPRITVGQKSSGFTGERDSADLVHYGIARVNVPKWHLFGKTGSPWYKRIWFWNDDRLRLVGIDFKTRSNFWEEMSNELEAFSVDGSESQILLYIHGYNVCFADAMVTTAQLGCDLKFPGIATCFSWASLGKRLGYPTDEATIEASVPSITSFIEHLLNLVGDGRVHLLVHSMGNRATLRAVSQLVQTASTSIKFGHIILAAPDVDTSVFRNLAHFYPRATSLRTTMYTSRRDQAVALSRWLHSYPRAGYTPPVTVVDGIDTVDVSDVSSNWIGHGYYAEAAPVLEDITKLIFYNASPDKGRRLRTKSDTSGSIFWSFVP